MSSVLKVDQIQSDTGTVNISSNVVFSSGLTSGSAAAPSIFPTGDTNTGIFFPAADTIAFAEGGAEAMRINSSGNLGLGVTPSAWDSLSKVMQIGAKGAVFGQASAGTIELASNAYYDGGYKYITTDKATHYYQYDGYHAWETAPSGTAGNAITFTERARITSGGYFKASNSGAYNDAAGPYHELRQSGVGSNLFVTTQSSGDPYGGTIDFTGTTPNNTTNYFLRCSDTTNTKLFIYSNGTVTNRTGTYNSFSDLKLKQDITDASSQWDDIKALRVVKYRLKDEVAADPTYPSYIGLIAQEAEQVSPGLIDDCPDFEEIEVTDEEGNVTTERRATGTVTKAVKYSILYMKAVKALQEAMERIETLEAKVSALESQ